MITVKLADFKINDSPFWLCMSPDFKVWAATADKSYMLAECKSLYFALLSAKLEEKKNGVTFHWNVDLRHMKTRAAVNSTGDDRYYIRNNMLLTAVIRNTEKLNRSHGDDIKKAYLLVKWAALEKHGGYKTDMFGCWSLVSDAVQTITKLTPREAARLWTPRKTYDGEKCGEKDYFYDRDYFNTLEPDKPFGAEDKMLEFCWEWQNRSLTDFLLCQMHCMDNLREMDSKPSLGEEFAHIIGLPVYLKTKNELGEDVLTDDEGNEIATAE